MEKQLLSAASSMCVQQNRSMLLHYVYFELWAPLSDIGPLISESYWDYILSLSCPTIVFIEDIFVAPLCPKNKQTIHP